MHVPYIANGWYCAKYGANSGPKTKRCTNTAAAALAHQKNAF
jgi:hypothetical protein